MQGFQKRLVSSGKFEPVAYDRSIEWIGFGAFRLTIREDDETMTWTYPTFEEAQQMMDEFPPEVFEGYVPYSVFYPSQKAG